jgi:uncharacterized membrane protein YbhN (UPF0104 family)
MNKNPKGETSAWRIAFLNSRLLGILVGLSLTVFLLARVHLEIVGKAMAEVGYGIVALVALHLLSITADAQGWHAVLRRLNIHPRRVLIIWIACVRNAVQTLIPVGASGFVYGYRALNRRRVPAHTALSSLIFETTVTTGAELSLLTGSAWLAYQEEAPIMHRVFLSYTPVVGILALVLGTILILQIRGNVFDVLSRGLARFGPEKRREPWARLPVTIKHDLQSLYRSPSVLLLNFVWQTASLLIGAASIWFIFFLLHADVPFALAVLFMCLARSLRSFGFLIPSAWGLQEGLFVVAAPLLGIPAAVALAVSLILRVRDFIFAFLVMAARHFTDARGTAMAAILAVPGRRVPLDE